MWLWLVNIPLEEQVSQNTFTVCSFVGEMQGPKNGLYFVSTRFLIVFPSSLFMHKVTMFFGGVEREFWCIFMQGGLLWSKFMWGWILWGKPQWGRHLQKKIFFFLLLIHRVLVWPYSHLQTFLRNQVSQFLIFFGLCWVRCCVILKYWFGSIPKGSQLPV